MNGFINSFGLFTGVTIAVLSAIFAYLNRDRYKTLIKDIYEPGNKELREQLITARDKNSALVQENTTLKVQITEKENRITDLKELNANLPNYTALNEKTGEVMKLMSNNHKATMNKLTDLARALSAKVDGGK